MNFDQSSIDEKLKALRACVSLMEAPPAPRKVSGSKASMTVEEKKSARIAVAIMKARAKKAQEAEAKPKQLELRPVDLSGKIPLRINSRLTVYIKPTDDPERIRAKYDKRIDTDKKRLEYMKQQLGYNYQF